MFYLNFPFINIQEKSMGKNSILIQTAALCIFLSCGNGIKNAQNFSPNLPPVLESVSSVFAADGSPVDKKNITSDQSIRVTITASDPEKKPLLYAISSDYGSIRNQTTADTGCSFIFYTKDITPDSAVTIRISITDEKKASLATVYDLGTGKTKAVITVTNIGKNVLMKNESTTLSLLSSSPGYFEIYCDNTIYEVTKMRSKTRTRYEDKDLSGEYAPVPLTAASPGYTSDYHVLLEENKKNKIWVGFIDDNQQIYGVSTEIESDAADPVITSQTPSKDAVNVSYSSVSICFSFNEEIDQTSFASAFKLTQGAAEYPCTMSSSSKSATFIPSGNLPLGAVMTAALSGVKDLAGNTLADTNFNFTTASGPVLSYNPNGATSGSCPENISVAIGTQIKVSANSGGLMRTGFSFLGWNTKADGSGIPYFENDDITMESSGINLYAQWAKISVSSVTLNKTSLSVLIAGTSQLIASVLPADAFSTGVTYTTSNPAAAIVSTAGLVEGIASGSAVITATADDGSGKSASCTVSVVEKTVAVSGISLDCLTMTMDKGISEILTESITPSDATNPSVT
jgi:uncharacterized protein YjdB